jgi:hypothetical protein
MVAPVMQGTGPVGVAVDPDEYITCSCTDDGFVVQNTIDVKVTPPGLPQEDAIINGVFQAGYTGTITANAGNGYDIVVIPDDLMIVGVWSAYAYCEDGAALSDSDTWGWTVVADAPTVDSQRPLNIETDLDVISARVQSEWGIDTTSLVWTFTPVAGQTMTAVTGGAIQADWAGAIIPLNAHPRGGPREVTIILRTWPELPQRHRLNISLTAETVVGT